jgi:formyl-CoA transferase/succinate--hydroxymethylglutarate CoA-transferase
MLLGDQGAEIIKIERPTGDDTRHQSNPMVGGENTAFLATNRNKKSVVVDLTSAAGLRLAHQLIEVCDVFVENFRPGKAEKLGLGWDDLRAINPRLIYCSISGWGADGPFAAKPGYASIAEAVGGLMSVTGERGGLPLKVGVSIVDNLTGLYAKDAITAALYARERTGQGQKVDTSLLESTVSILSMSAYAYLLAGVVPDRLGSEHAFIVPWRNFATADGYLCLAAGNESQWRKLCDVLARPELAADERFQTMRDRSKNRTVLYGLLEQIFSERTTAEWLELCDRVGIAVAPVQTIDEVFRHPQVLHRRMLESVEHATLGEIPQVGHAQKFSETPARIELAPPVLGQHTAQVLAELAGCSSDELTQLREAGVISCADLSPSVPLA